MIEGVDLAALTAWMDRQGLGSGAIAEPELLAGGTQNILLRFTRAGRSYVLRRPPPHLRANSNETMRREARVLAALAGTNVPHPGLIAACPEEDVIGASFYLMEPVDGFAAPNGLPPLHLTPAVQHRMGLSMVEAIAALGAVDYLAVGLEGFGKTENYLGRQVARWQAQLDTFGFAPIRNAWLARAARLGEPIIARTGNSESHGIFEGIDVSGALILKTPSGRQVIPAADVYFAG